MRRRAADQLQEEITAAIVLQPAGHFGRRRWLAAFLTLPYLLSALRARRAERAARDRTARDDTVTAGSGGLLAVTATRVALFRLRQGFTGLKLHGYLAVVALADVAAIELNRTASRAGNLVDIVMVDGHRYRFELSALSRRRLRRVATAIGLPGVHDATPPRSKVEIAIVVFLMVAILAIAALVVWKARMVQ